MSHDSINPTLHIDTSHLDDRNLLEGPPSPLLSPTSGSRVRSRSGSHSLLPSFRISSSQEDKLSFDAPRVTASHGTQKARAETRKLLSHILTQLKTRPKPPSASDVLDMDKNHRGKGLAAVLQTVKGAVSSKGRGREGNPHRSTTSDDPDSEPDDETDFTTDDTFDLMTQLKDVLVISALQGWDIFHEDSLQYDSNFKKGLAKSERSRRRRSIQKTAKRDRSRSKSPGLEGDEPLRASQLLQECITLISSIIVEDCRFQASSPKLTRPPNALQAVTLDIAQYLIHAHREDSGILSQVAMAVIPAFYTFRSAMHARLLAFFDDGVLGVVLQDLGYSEGEEPMPSAPAHSSWVDNTTSLETPIVSIFVDEAQEDKSASSRSDTGWRPWSSPTSMTDGGLRSANAPSQDISVYQLSSLIPPLLAAILENVDLSSNRLPVMHRFYRLFDRLCLCKPDAYLDILAVIAYHTPTARHSAVGILLSYWPKAVGHLLYSRPFVIMNYSETLARTNQTPMLARRPHDHPYAHQFVPWRFTPGAFPVNPAWVSPSQCRACSDVISGFGLLCSLCMCAVHLDCYDYPDGSFSSQYVVASEPGIQKMAVHRFCHILSHRRGSAATIFKSQHTYRLVNLFTLTLCHICNQPLWGHVMQALKCGSCKQFAHPSCVARGSAEDLPRCRSEPINDKSVTIKWSHLRQSFADHYRDSFFTEANLETMSYEELSVFSAILWTQLQILDNGIALGSIVINQDDESQSESNGQALEEFELHYFVSLYDAFLSSGRLSVSGALADHILDNKVQASNLVAFYDWNTLAFMVSVMKQPPSDSLQTTNTFGSELLSPGQLSSSVLPSEDSPYPFEVVRMAHLRDQLGSQFHLYSETAARYVLTHLFVLGFFQRSDLHQVLFDGSPHPETQYCHFPIPLGLEISTDVETLASAIEACLSDLELSINETAFLLLIRKFWPDGMLTDYALRRFLKILLVWILSEDDNIADTLREYVARGRSVPGVRSGADIPPWPAPSQARPTSTGSPNNGGEYVSGRRELRNIYAARWLLALHDRDIELYPAMVFDILVEHSEESSYTDEYFNGKVPDDIRRKQQVAVADNILRSIIKLCQASVVFTAFDDLFKHWLQYVHHLHIDKDPITSLFRLFNRDIDSSHRFSTTVDTRATIADTSDLTSADPLHVLVEAATQSKESFQQCLYWLSLFVRSGVEITVPVFMQFASLIKRFSASFEECALLITAILWAAWLKSMGRQELQVLVAIIHEHVQHEVIERLQSRKGIPAVLVFLRQSWAACLLLYGCDRNKLLTCGMLSSDETEGILSRRKVNSRASTVIDPIIVDARLINAVRAYVEIKVEGVCSLAAKFFDILINDSSLMESYEIDNFILRNGVALSSCMWQFYDIQLPEIRMLRAAFLLRVIVVDPQPFQTYLQELSATSVQWEMRLQTALRLFRIVLDVASPVFDLEDRQWRSSIVDVFIHFFSYIWTDTREEVRLAVDTWAQTLLPAHFDAITLCWNESLTKSTISERVKVVSFLHKIRGHFPSWQVLSWDTVIETLLETDFRQANGDNEDGAVAAHLSMYGLSSIQNDNVIADPDLMTLRVSLLSLALRMIADGITVNTFTLLRLKEDLVQVLGYQDVQMVSSATGTSFLVRYNDLGDIPSYAGPCLDDLILVLDCPKALDIPPSAISEVYSEDDTPTSLLVGSIFVDVLLDIFIQADTLGSLPFVTIKNLLKSFVIVLYKHDFDSKPLRHLQANLRKAARRVLDLLLSDLSYELRQLALSISQVFIKRWPAVIGNFVCEAIESAEKLMTALDYQQNSEDILVDQTKMFLQTTLTTYSHSGVFNVLCKRQLSSEFFKVIHHIVSAEAKSRKGSPVHEYLRDALLRDTLARAADNDVASYQVVIDNIATYVELVHHANYSADLMQSVGICLINIVRRAADWPAESFNPSPLLLLSCTLIQHNKALSRDLLAYMDTLLRTALVRFNVSAASLSRVLQVTNTLYRKSTAAVTSGRDSFEVNPIGGAMLEILSEALRGKIRLTGNTLAALIEALVGTVDRKSGTGLLPTESLVRLAEDGLGYLCHEGFIDGSSDSDLHAPLEVAKLALQGAEIQPSMLDRQFRSPPAMRIWNMIALAALSYSRASPAALLFEHFSEFTLVYCTALNIYRQAQISMDVDAQDAAHEDLSSAYASIKLWLLLARNIQASGMNSREDLMDNMIWNELWPPFESVLLALDTDPKTGNLSPLTSSTWTSVADLFLFLHQLRCSVALNKLLQSRVLNELKAILRGGTKLSRLLRAMTEPPPEVPPEFFVSQITTEIRAMEKLRAAKRNVSLPERGRRGLA